MRLSLLATPWLLKRTAALAFGLMLLSSKAGAETHRRDQAIGASVGIPQLIALTYEREVAPVLRLQGNFGSALVLNTFTGRAILSTPSGLLRPYVFAGMGMAAAISGGAEMVGFAWTGIGLRAHVGRVIVFVEQGALDDGQGSEHESYIPVGAAGILFEF